MDDWKIYLSLRAEISSTTPASISRPLHPLRTPTTIVLPVDLRLIGVQKSRTKTCVEEEIGERVKGINISYIETVSMAINPKSAPASSQKTPSEHLTKRNTKEQVMIFAQEQAAIDSAEFLIFVRNLVAHFKQSTKGFNYLYPT